jgi:tRNA-dihydrouridine synthase B
MVENVGAKALTIHCRTRAQGHKGEPDFSWIPQVKQAVSIPIFVNGGLDTPGRIQRAFDETGCDGVMIGQAAINNPWIFRQARYYMEHGVLLSPPDLDERVRVLLEHLRLSVSQKGEQRAVLEFRKHYTGYLRDLPNIAKIRSELMHFTELSPIVDHIHRYVAWLKSTETLTTV